jgi:4-amino-4-deoxy-L-arabinose transferase-like glycosyltransferase
MHDPVIEGASQRLGRQLPLVITAYFFLHLAIRVLVSGSTELDEAEQVLLTQHLAWGYGSQPPLYTWLQAAVFGLFGQNVFSLALLKNTLLLSLFLFTFLAAREMAGEDRPACAAMVSLLLVPQIAWESQRDLTHSVLGTAMMAATWYAAVRVCRRGQRLDYLLLGLFSGLGILGKYNVAVALAALYVAWLSLPELRPRLLNSRLLLSIFLFLLVTGGHLHWMLTHAEDTLRQADTFQRGALTTFWADYLRGGFGLTRAIVSFIAPLIILFVFLFHSKSVSWFRNDDRYANLLARTLLFGVVLCLLIVLGFRVTNLKDRWMQPLLFATAIYLSLIFRRQLAERGLRRLLTLAAAIGLVILVLLPSRTLFASHMKGRNDLNAPFDQLSEALRHAGFEQGNIVASNRWLGGNLSLRFKESLVLVPELSNPPLWQNGPWLVVWDASRDPEMPPALRQLCEGQPGCRTDAPVQLISATSLYNDGEMQLGFLLIP